MMDADGSGRKQFQLPNNGYIGGDFSNSVSPDGKWLAYFTGTADARDLALNVFDLEEQTGTLVANLLAPDYPENLKLTTLRKESCPADYPDCQVAMTQSDFEFAIVATIAWSPDSKTLAFAAQIDGPSSDVYLYSLEDKSIRRLVNDLKNVWYITWSPNGNKVLYENFQSGNNMTRELYIADPNKTAVQSPSPIRSGAFWGLKGWVDDDLLLMFDSGDGGARHNLRYLNIETRQTELIWKYEIEIFTIAPGLHGMLFPLPPEEVAYFQLQMEPGTYFLPVHGKPIRVSEEIYIPLDKQPALVDSFFAIKDDNFYRIKISDPDVQLVKENVDFEHAPYFSPDNNWLMFANADGLQLYSADLESVKSWDIHNAKMIWRSDSQGMFLFIGTAMYYLHIPDGEPVLIEDCAPDYCSGRDYVWLP